MAAAPGAFYLLSHPDYDRNQKRFVGGGVSRLDLATGRRAGQIPQGADSSQRFLRTWIHLVRGQLRERRGDADGATESYARAVREGQPERCWFADLAHERLERSGRLAAPADADGAGVDPAVRRKRKKRR